MDANRYATKKTIAQGMLDIALLTANASQLKYILQIGERHEFYKLMLILIVMSIILQVGVLNFPYNFQPWTFAGGIRDIESFLKLDEWLSAPSERVSNISKYYQQHKDGDGYFHHYVELVHISFRFPAATVANCVIRYFIISFFCRSSLEFCLLSSEV